MDSNPLLQPWDGPYGLAPFTAIRPAHIEPAIRAAMAAHLAELDVIASDRNPVDVANTAVALDDAGRQLQAIALLFSNLCAAETSPELQQVEAAVMPLLAAHEAAVLQHAGVFARLDALHAQRHQLGLEGETLRLVERLHLDFCLAGAQLPAAKRQRAAEIAGELAGLCTQFTQQVLADEAAFELPLTESELRGLPSSLVAALAQAAATRGRSGHVVTLARSLVVPLLTLSPHRALRQRIWQAWVERGRLDPQRDNLKTANRILALRHELATLHGLSDYAAFALRDTMAQSQQRVTALLQQVWQRAVAKAVEDREVLRAQAAAMGEPTDLEPWDWRYLAEQVRATRFAVDDALVKPYFALDNMLTAAFDCAFRLFQVRFIEQPGAALYHPDARLFEVHRDGNLIGLFVMDNFARPSKRSGAWMNEYRYQCAGTLPIVGNHNNFAKPPAGEPCLLSLEDVKTLFHELGHGLHGLLSRATYQRLAGTRVLRDFVELPSQIFEHWALQPEVLAQHARHAVTGEPIAPELIAKVHAASRFNQAFDTVEFTASALLDMELHGRSDGGTIDIAAFEQAERARLQMPREIALRHRPAHFLHLFSGPDYAAGYYVYMWASVLDNDGFGAFDEAGSVFDRGVADRLLQHIYAAGNTVEPGETYRRFRGRDPHIDAMLAKRGLL